MIELLKSLYEQNEVYHEVKERMAWQALAIYLAFSLFFMNWLHANSSSVTIYPKWQLLLAIFGAVVPAIGFIQRQIYLKALSVEKSERYTQFMREHPDPSEKQFSLLVGQVQDLEKSLSCRQKRRIFWCNGRPGTWALVPPVVFCLLQFFLVMHWF
jgi:hypothetical protein